MTCVRGPIVQALAPYRQAGCCVVVGLVPRTLFIEVTCSLPNYENECKVYVACFIGGEFASSGVKKTLPSNH